MKTRTTTYVVSYADDTDTPGKPYGRSSDDPKRLATTLRIARGRWLYAEIVPWDDRYNIVHPEVTDSGSPKIFHPF